MAAVVAAIAPSCDARGRPDPCSGRRDRHRLGVAEARPHPVPIPQRGDRRGSSRFGSSRSVLATLESARWTSARGIARCLHPRATGRSLRSPAATPSSCASWIRASSERSAACRGSDCLIVALSPDGSRVVYANGSGARVATIGGQTEYLPIPADVEGCALVPGDDGVALRQRPEPWPDFDWTARIRRSCLAGRGEALPEYGGPVYAACAARRRPHCARRLPAGGLGVRPSIVRLSALDHGRHRRRPPDDL